MNQKHVEALNDALARIEAGQSLASVLAAMAGEASYDEATLRRITPDLMAAQGLRRARKPRLRAVYRGRMHEDLVAAVEAEDARTGAIQRTLASLLGQRPLWPVLATRAVPLALALVFSLGSVVVISADSRPEQLLYPLQPISRSILRSLERVSAPVLDIVQIGRTPVTVGGGQEGGSGADGGEGAVPVHNGESESSKDRSDATGLQVVALPTAVRRLATSPVLATAETSSTATPSALAVRPAPSATLAGASLAPPTATTRATAEPTLLPTNTPSDEPSPPDEPDPTSTREPSPPPVTDTPEPSPVAPTPTTPVSTPAATVAPTEPTVVACGGTVTGPVLDVDGNPYLGGPFSVKIVASTDPGFESFDKVGVGDADNGRYIIELDESVCPGQVERFHLLAYDADMLVPLGYHGDPGGPTALDVGERSTWGEPEVRLFIGMGAGGGAMVPLQPCPPEDEIGSISGRVTDADDETVAGADVVLFDLAGFDDVIDRYRETQTSADGSYALQKVCRGRYHLVAIYDNGIDVLFGAYGDEDGEPDVISVEDAEPNHVGIDVKTHEPDWPAGIPRPPVGRWR